LDINGTNFTPNARFHLEIRNVPVNKGQVVLRDHAFDSKGDFQIFESFKIATVSVDADLPDIIVSILDEGSGVTASVHVSPRPFVVRV
jgi:hypothetical protein